MFKNKKPKIDPNITDTLIGEGTHFEGKIKSEGGIRIEGRLTGDLESVGDVTIGEKGVAHSQIRARNVIIAGQVIGNVTSAGKLIIKSSGNLQGNLSAQELSIEAGGIFQGASQMEQGKEPQAQEQKKQPVKEKEQEVVLGKDPATVLKTW